MHLSLLDSERGKCLSYAVTKPLHYFDSDENTHSILSRIYYISFFSSSLSCFEYISSFPLSGVFLPLEKQMMSKQQQQQQQQQERERERESMCSASLFENSCCYETKIQNKHEKEEEEKEKKRDSKTVQRDG